MVSSVSMKFDTAALHAELNRLSVGVQKQLRPAAQAGAQVFYDEVLANVPESEKGHWFHGTSFKTKGTKYWFAPGTLKRSIYQVFSKDNSDAGRATYHISWNHQTAPYGFMVEYGTSRAPAHSFLNPAYDTMKKIALDAANDRMAMGVRQVVAGLKS